MVFYDHADLRLRHSYTIHEPWMGVIHQPPLLEVPQSVVQACFGDPLEFYDGYSQLPSAPNAISHMKAFITLSEHAKQFFAAKFPDATAYTLRYPHEAVVQHRDDKPKYILHNGTFLKNMAILNHFEKPFADQTKLLILTENIYSPKRYQFYRSFFAETRPWFDDVEIVNRQSAKDYDDILQDSIVVMEYFDCSASTTVVECMACNVPIVVNRHPAVVEYLGVDYPLFYDSYEEIPDLIRIWQSSVDYLRSMPKDKLKISCFVDNLQSIIRKEEQ